MNHNFYKNSFERGTILLIISQIVFFVSSYVVHVVAANTVSPTDYGRFGVVMGILSIVYIFLSTALPESATKYISEGRDQKAVTETILKYQLLFSLLLSFLIYFSAYYISDFLNDKELTKYIRILSILIPVRAILHTYRGVFNGLAYFSISSSISIFNSLLKLLFSLFLLFLGYKITGLLLGYISAAFLALIASFVIFRRVPYKGGKQISSSTLLSFAFPLIFFTFCFNILLNIDIIILKYMLENPNEVGYYNSVKAISSVILGLGMAISNTLLPTVSKIKETGSRKDVEIQLNNLFSYLIIFLLPICVFISVNSKNLINLFFPEEYEVASSTLSILVFAVGFLSLLIILGSIFNGLGKPKIPLYVSISILPLYFFMSYKLVSLLGFNGIAFASLASNVLVVFFLYILIKKEYTVHLFSKHNLLFLLVNIIIYFILFLLNLEIFHLTLFSVILYSLYLKFVISFSPKNLHLSIN